MGESVSAASLAAGPASSSPRLRLCHTAAEAVSHLSPQRVAPEGTSAAVVTESNSLGTHRVYGLGIPMTEIGR